MNLNTAISVIGLVASILSILAFIWTIYESYKQNNGITKPKVIALVITAIVLFSVLSIISYSWDNFVELVEQKGNRESLKPKYNGEKDRVLVRYPLPYKNIPNLEISTDSGVCLPDITLEKEYGFEIKVFEENCAISWKSVGTPSNGVRKVNNNGSTNDNWQRILSEGLEGKDVSKIEDLPKWVENGTANGSAIFRKSNLVRAIQKGFKLLEGADLSGAFIYAHSQQVKEGKYEKWPTDIKGANLKSAILNGVEIYDANLNGSVLDGSSMMGASVNDVDLSGASLIDVDLTGTKFRKINFSGTALRGAVFDGTVLEGVTAKANDMSFISFDSATFTGSDFSSSNFRNANLDNVTFEKVNLSGVDFTGSSLNNTRFINCNLNGATIDPSTSSKLYITGSDLEDAYIDGKNIKRTKLRKNRYWNASLISLKGLPAWVNQSLNEQGELKKYLMLAAINKGLKDLSGADLSGFDFSDQELKKLNFSNTILKGVSFENSKLSEIDFSEADLEQADFRGSIFVDTNFSLSNFGEYTNFQEADLSDGNVTLDFFSVAAFDKAKFSPNQQFPEAVKLGLTNKLVFSNDLAIKATADRDIRDLSMLDFSNNEISDKVFKDVYLHGADFSGSKLKNIQFIDTNLRKADFSNSSLENVSFIRSDVSHTSFWNSRMSNSTILDSDLASSTFRSSRLKNTEITGSNLNHTSWINSFIDHSKILLVRLNKAQILDTKISNSEISTFESSEFFLMEATFISVSVDKSFFKQSVNCGYYFDSKYISGGCRGDTRGFGPQNYNGY